MENTLGYDEDGDDAENLRLEHINKLIAARADTDPEFRGILERFNITNTNIELPHLYDILNSKEED